MHFFLKQFLSDEISLNRNFSVEVLQRIVRSRISHSVHGVKSLTIGSQVTGVSVNVLHPNYIVCLLLISLTLFLSMG